jgi:hypothetical protein
MQSPRVFQTFVTFSVVHKPLILGLEKMGTLIFKSDREGEVRFHLKGKKGTQRRMISSH